MRQLPYLFFLLALAACGGRSTGPADHAAGSSGSLSGDSGDLRDAAPEGGAKHCVFRGFAPAVAYGTMSEPAAIAVVDRSHDGHADLLVGERGAFVGDDSSELFTNAGDGTFSASSTYGASANEVGTLVSADFDGDGYVDLASLVPNPADDGGMTATTALIGIDFGRPGGLFATGLVTFTVQAALGQLATGDFNGDGHPDLAFAGYDEIYLPGFVTDAGAIADPGYEPGNFTLNVYLNRGGGTFGAPTSLPTEDWQTIATGDFNGDGHLDMAVYSSTGTNSFGVFLNAGDGSFPGETDYSASTTWIAYGLAAGDFNGDGLDDLTTTSIVDANLPGETNVLDVFDGMRDGGLSAPITDTIASLPQVVALVTGDFNGDGHLDVAMALGGQWGQAMPIPVAVFPNRGDGTFGDPVTYGVGGQAFQYITAIVAADLNGDGVTDIAVTTSGEEAMPNPESLTVLLSQCE